MATDKRAEQAVLGSLIIGDGAREMKLVDKDFRRLHRPMFNAIRRIATRGEDLDETTITAEMAKCGSKSLEELGGYQYLAEIVSVATEEQDVVAGGRGWENCETIVYALSQGRKLRKMMPDDIILDSNEHGIPADADDIPHPAEFGDVSGDPVGEAEFGTVLYHFPDAPIHENAEIPFPYSIDDKGQLVKPVTEGQGDHAKTVPRPVSDGLILITDLDHDVNDGLTYVTLVFRGHGGAWGDCVVKKGVIANANKVSDLANFGAPVLSTRGKGIIQWLSAYEAANFRVIRNRRISGRMGWHEVGSRLAGFLFADEWVGDQSMEIHHQSESGITQLAQAVRAVGSIEEEQTALEISMAFPTVAVVIGAALAAPMLRILGCPPFTLSLSGTTSTGKTSALRVAGAIWGSTDERKPDSILQTWNQTQNAIIEKASSLDGIPFMLDDTQVATGHNVIQNTIYALSTGRGKGRLNRLGKAVGEKSSRTILISTGEMPMLESSHQGGTRARVLEVWGDPWGTYCAATGQRIRAAMHLTERSSGNTGRAWIRYLLDTRGEWDHWQRLHKSRQKQLEDRLAQIHGNRHGALLGRLAEYISVIESALYIATEAGIIRDEGHSGRVAAIEHLADGAISEAVSKDVPIEALKLALEIATSRRKDFYEGVHHSANDAPYAGWMGRWDIGADRIYFVPSKLKAALEDEGYQYGALVRAWAARGYLITQGGKHNSVVTRLGETTCRMVAVTVAALKKELGFDPQADDQRTFGAEVEGD